jgi:hypothetical protein
MKKVNHRHGDVILKAIKAIPKEAGPMNGKTLAEGEVTGHSHQIAEGVAHLFRYDDKTYVRVVSEYALLRHQEHKEIKLPQGDYEYWIQQEWKENGWAKVID